MIAPAPTIKDRLSERALALPEANETVSHGSPGWQVAGKKFFAYFSDNHHGDGIISVCVKTSGPEEQDMLMEADPDLYYRPAYIAHRGWIGMRLDLANTDWDQVAYRLERSWQLAAPKRLAAMLSF
jgi:phosphoribosylglycinamide formyltransferase-1